MLDQGVIVRQLLVEGGLVLHVHLVVLLDRRQGLALGEPLLALLLMLVKADPGLPLLPVQLRPPPQLVLQVLLVVGLPLDPVRTLFPQRVHLCLVRRPALLALLNRGGHGVHRVHVCPAWSMQNPPA